MRPSLLVLMCLMCCSILTRAQSDGPTEAATPEKAKPVNFELGLNLTGLVSQLIPSGGFLPTSSTYLVQTKLLLHNRQGLRAAFNYNRSDRTEPEPRQTDELFDLRFGYEFYTSLGKRWSVFYGLDFIAGQSQSRSSDDSDPFFGEILSVSRVYYYGGGPVVGVQIKIHERIRLYTESMFYYSRVWNEDRTEFQTPLIEDVVSKSRSQTFRLSAPSSLFLAINF